MNKRMSTNDPNKPIRMIEQYVQDNPDLVEPLIARAQRYLAAGDGDSMLLFSAVLCGLGAALKEHVENNAVFTSELTIQDCLGPKKH